MSFISATQTTDLDRTDNLRPVTGLAAKYRRATLVGNRDEPCLVTAARLGSEAATAELVARYEPRIRAIVSRFKTGNAPDTDRQQAALEGLMAAIRAAKSDATTGFFTLAHLKITQAVKDANAAYADKPTERHAEALYWAAMKACDGDAVKARRYAGLLRLSVLDLEPLAEAGDMLAREILDSRIDRFDAAVRRDPDSAPEWDEFAAQTGRGLDGPTFDVIHGAVTYLDASAETDDGEGESGHDVTADPNAGDPFAEVEERTALVQLVGALDDRSRDIIARHLDGQTDREIADALGLSRPRVANLRAAAVRRMRKLAA